MQRRRDQKCNLCGAASVNVIFTTKQYPDAWKTDILRCGRCGLIFRDIMKNSSLAVVQNHDADYLQLSYPDKYSAAKIALLKSHIQSISVYRHYNRVLDVGSGKGLFLYLCAEDGWDVRGVEINHELVEQTKSMYKIDVFNGTLEQARFPDSFFDAVTFWNVLDYLSDPDKALREAYRVLRHGGTLFLRFPNATFHVICRKIFAAGYHLWKGIRNYDHTAIHRYSFAEKTITLYLRKCGYQRVAVNNSIATWIDETSRNYLVQKIMTLIIKSFVGTVKIMSNGNLLIGPSLCVNALK